MSVRAVLQGLSAGGAAVVLASLAVGCGGAVAMNDLPLRESFADCDGFTMNDEVATIDCPDGELRISVAQPEVSPVHFVPLRFEPSVAAVVVTATAHAPTPGAAWGVGCLASGPGEPGRGYALLVGPEGGAAILRFDAAAGTGEEDGRTAQQFEVLLERELGIVASPRRSHDLRLRCVEQGNVVRLHASVDGGKPFTASDRKGIGPFVGAHVIVVTDRPGTDVRFDDVVAEQAN
jgi:hypothetical protein